ncbi:CpxP family protein [Vibrio clamense]|uniref:CpxP family protein n=1 Tax=Vibrio clamense TaxID=2910254 RepID=UPI003D1F341F
MKNAKKIILAAVVLPLTLGTASAFAFGGGKGHHKGPDGKCGGFDKGMMRQLDLTDEQRDQLKEMREAGRKEMKGKYAEKRAEMQTHHAKVQALVLADNFDEAAANDLAKEMVEQQSERRVQMMKKKHEMFSVLTAEQKAKVQELQQERMQECSAKMEKRMKNN